MQLAALLTAFTIFLGLAACDQDPHPSGRDSITLDDEKFSLTFNVPSEYRASGNGRVMTIDIKYPSMEPGRADRIPERDTLTVWVTASAFPSRTDYLVAKAEKEFNPEFPRRDYFAGTDGPYQLYKYFYGKQGVPLTESSTATVRVFRAEDGALVGVTDPGKWSHGLTARRRLGEHMHVQYFIPRLIAKEFIAIDKDVIAFVQRHLKATQQAPAQTSTKAVIPGQTTTN